MEIDFPNSEVLRKYGEFQNVKYSKSYPSVKKIVYTLNGQAYELWEIEDKHSHVREYTDFEFGNF